MLSFFTAPLLILTLLQLAEDKKSWFIGLIALLLIVLSIYLDLTL
jgi:hypothetical protein